MELPSFGWQDIVVAALASAITWLGTILKRLGGSK
jgi:hypothetical protein